MKSWPEVALGDIFTIARGGSPRPIDAFITDAPDGVNWIMIGDATEGSKYISSTKKRIRREGVSRSREVKPGDFLLTNSMSFGHPYILDTPGCIHDGWLVLSPRKSDVDHDYFYHLLGSPVVYAKFERLAAGAVVKNLNSELVRGVKVPLPPLPEQRRIADILDKADAIRRKRKEAIALTEELLRSAFLEMFGDPVTNPKGWPVRALVDLVDVERPITYGILMPGPDMPGGVPYVRVVDMRGGRVSVESVRRTSAEIAYQYRRSLLRAGDLLLSIRGHVGRMAVTPPELDGANITQDTARLAAGPSIDPFFLLGVLRSPGIQHWMQQHVKGVAVQGINLTDVKRVPVPVPPMELQQNFGKAFRHIQAVEGRMRAQRADCDALFAGLVDRAFRGALGSTDGEKGQLSLLSG